MAGATDLYFPTEDSQKVVDNMPNAVFEPIHTVWGHFAGGPGTNHEDVKYLDDKFKGLLAS